MAPEPKPEPKLAQLPPQLKGDSSLGGQVRSGSDYYIKWDKFAKEMEGDDENEEEAKSKVKRDVRADNSGRTGPLQR
jgi:hypothetical protein